MMTISPARLFQCYTDNFFKLPKEIKNDIIYCQRALKVHIRVHQMVLEALQKQEHPNFYQKKRILEELETEIYEINAEQHYLFLRLRRIIDEFFKRMKKNRIPVDKAAMNMIISKEIIPHVHDDSEEIVPMSVVFRSTEEKLLKKYFELQKLKVENTKGKEEEYEDEEKVIYEIIDTDDEGKVVVTTIPKKTIKPICKVEPGTENVQSNGHSVNVKSSNNGNSGTNHLPQMSLLKPIAQRLVGMPAAANISEDIVQIIKVEAGPEKKVAKILDAPPALPAHDIIQDIKPKETEMELPVSKNVKMSRLNLRQALKKARTQAAANVVARPTNGAIPSKEIASVTQAIATQLHPNEVSRVTAVKKIEPKTKPIRNAVPVTKVIELPSSSEDSNPERELLQNSTSLFDEPTDTRTLPEHYGQEMFLRYFNLFTPELHIQMQQRRSKRRRRNVHSNERADFHYGRIENYGHLPTPEDQKKKRKAFLLSPQVKRNLQSSKRVKRVTADKIDDAVPSRSSSSSPDDKRGCNECLKSGGCLEQCEGCKGFYHQTCHRDEKPKSDKNAITIKKDKRCPACKRAHEKLVKKEAQQYKSLNCTVHQLEVKMAKEKDRRANLQQASKMYKIQMRNLFNIVNTIKSDQENDSSE